MPITPTNWDYGDRAGLQCDGNPATVLKVIRALGFRPRPGPAQIRPVPKSLLARGKALVEGVEVDLDAVLPDDEA